MRTTALLAALFVGGSILGTTTTSAVTQTALTTKQASSIAALTILAPKAEKPTSKKVIAVGAPKVQAMVPAPVVVTVAAGDYLTKIADENATTASRLFYANTTVTNPDIIYPGQQLRVPADSEDLTPRDLPVATVTPIIATQAVAATRSSAYTAAGTSITADGSVWDRIAACEAGGNWSIKTGNGYYGGLQFTLSSWQGVGGSGLPSDASRDEQIARGQILQARQGWGAWPVCSVKAGL